VREETGAKECDLEKRRKMMMEKDDSK